MSPLPKGSRLTGAGGLGALTSRLQCRRMGEAGSGVPSGGTATEAGGHAALYACCVVCMGSMAVERWRPRRAAGEECRYRGTYAILAAFRPVGRYLLIISCYSTSGYKVDVAI